MTPSSSHAKLADPFNVPCLTAPVERGLKFTRRSRGTGGGRVGWQAPLRRASSVVRIGTHYWRDPKWRPAGSTRSSTSGFVRWRELAEKILRAPSSRIENWCGIGVQKCSPCPASCGTARPFDLDGSRRDEGRGHDPAVAANSMCEAGRSRSSAGSCTSPGTPSGRSCARVRPPSASAGPSPLGYAAGGIT